MSNYQLKVITATGEQTYQLNLQQTLVLEATPYTQYQILDLNGQLIGDLKTERINQNDLAVYLGENEHLNVLIQEYYNYHPIISSAYSDSNEILFSFATYGEETAVLAKEVGTEAVSNTAVSNKVLYGMAAVTGIAGLVAMGGGGKSGSPQPMNITVKLDPIASDNVINAVESGDEVELSGTFTASQPITSAQVMLKIGTISVPAQVDGNRFVAQISGKILAEHGQVEVTVDAENNQSKGTAKVEQTYEVDTQITAPIITFEAITNDNVINLAESGHDNVIIRGTVQNVENSEAKADDTIHLEINGQTFDGKLVAGNDANTFSFSVEVDGSVLAADPDRLIKATLDTKDRAGNTLTTKAEHSYLVDTEIADPIIRIEQVTADNTVNIAERDGGDIVIRGQVENPTNAEAKAGNTVILTVGQTEVTATLDSNLSFSAPVSGSVLAENNKITAKLATSDAAQNSKTTTHEHAYKVDTEIAAPTLTINTIAGDDIINAVEKREEAITVRGYAVNGANAEAKPNDIVELRIGELVVRTPLSESLTFEVPVSTIALVNHQTITATLVTQDRAQNSITATKGKTITVDDVLNLSVAVTRVDHDNLINIADSNKRVTLNGTYTADSDVKAGSVKINVSLKGTTYSAVVNEQDKSWTLEVDGDLLVNGQGENTITAAISAEDNAGNSAEASSQHQYHVDTLIDKPVISILSIAEDDVIDATEAKGSITIRGVVENAEGNGPVILRCPCAACHGGWKEVEAQVQEDGKFEVSVVVSETSLADAKLKSEERKIKANYTARDQAGNEAQADEASRPYELDLDDRREINITQIGNNFGLATQATTRISGTITEFGGIAATPEATTSFGHLYNVGQNARLIRMVKLVIGEKTYQVGFNGVNKTFYADIPNSDLAEIAGKEVRIDFSDILENTKDSFYKFNRVHVITTKNGKQTVDSLTNLTPTAKQFTLEGDMLVKNGDNSYSIKADISAQTEIRGVVKGDVAVGEVIDVKVGDHIVKTEVQSDKSFSVKVDNSHLANNASKVVTATLASDSSVRDDEIYLDSKAVSANFVSQHKEIPASARKIDHTKDDYNFFYPIDKMDTRDGRGGLTKFLFLRKVDIGGSEAVFKVKFHFLRENEIGEIPPNTQGLRETVTDGTVQEIRDNFKEMFRYAYKELTRYTNLEFEEVSSWRDVDGDKGTLIYFGDLQQKEPGAAALAFQGGNLVWDPKFTGLGDGYYHLVMHEILHTLNLAHTHDALSGVEFNPGPASATNHVAEASTEFSKLSYWNVDMFDGMRDIGIYDLAYLHYRFGVNRTHRAGDDVYTFKNYDARKVDRDVYIWDGNGIDTFDASAEKEGVTVNLTPGSWNYRGTERKFNFITDGRTVYDKHQFFGLDPSTPLNGALNNSNAIRDNAIAKGSIEFNNYNEGQSFIGYGTQIENLIGSKFADKLTGNNADNNIFGGAGDDTIAGGLGDDFINGGEGNDLMFGGEGNDSYVVDSPADVITEQAGQGTDQVYSLIDYTLENHVENLTLIGSNAKIGTGNELNNTIRGNDTGNTLNGMAGDDILIGGLGKDTLTGGAGRDTFVFDSALNGKADTITDFTRGEDKIQLSKAVFSAISDDLSNLNQHLFYDAGTGKLSYNAGNSGAADAITFAVVTGLGNIDNNTFILG